MLSLGVLKTLINLEKNVYLVNESGLTKKVKIGNNKPNPPISNNIPTSIKKIKK